MRRLHRGYRPVGGRSEVLCVWGRGPTAVTERMGHSDGMILKSGSRVVSSAGSPEVLKGLLEPCWAGIRPSGCARHRARRSFSRNRGRLCPSHASPMVSHESGRCRSGVRSSPGKALNAVSVVTRPRSSASADPFRYISIRPFRGCQIAHRECLPVRLEPRWFIGQKDDAVVRQKVLIELPSLPVRERSVAICTHDLRHS